MPGDRSYDPAAASHRALRGIRRELDRHPLVASVRGFPDGKFTQVVAEIATERTSVDAETATLTVRWFAGETPDARVQFSFHYSDGTGDLGWHHEPSPYVEEWGHFQKRDEPSAAYTYEPYEFSSTNPTRVVWEVLSRLTEHIE